MGMVSTTYQLFQVIKIFETRKKIINCKIQKETCKLKATDASSPVYKIEQDVS